MYVHTYVSSVGRGEADIEQGLKDWLFLYSLSQSQTLCYVINWEVTLYGHGSDGGHNVVINSWSNQYRPTQRTLQIHGESRAINPTLLFFHKFILCKALLCTYTYLFWVLHSHMLTVPGFLVIFSMYVRYKVESPIFTNFPKSRRKSNYFRSWKVIFVLQWWDKAVLWRFSTCFHIF
jgi:hypothetical protein